MTINKNHCKYCNKKFNSKIMYYCHMKIHVTPETKDQFTFKDLELIEKYFNQRRETKKRSYKKTTSEPKYICNICNKKLKTNTSLNFHYIGKHSEEELIENGLSHELIEKLQIRHKYRLQYNKNYKHKVDVNKSFKEAINMAKKEIQSTFEQLQQLSTAPIIYQPIINININ